MDDAVGWAVAIGFCFFTFKYLFSGSSSGGGARGRRVIAQSQIDAVTSMFPQISPTQARYELENNGGSVERAVERALREGSLPEPPAGFFVDPSAPPPPPPAPTPAPVARAQASSGATSATPATPSSLISRLHLEARLDELPPSAEAKGKAKAVEEGSPAPATPKGKGKQQGTAWEASPELREKSLKERKAKMVLEARRRMQEKEQQRKDKEMESNPMYS